MSSFTSPLNVEPLDGTEYHWLRKPFTYAVGSLDSGDDIVVPRGFVTNFASIPRWLWRIYPPQGRYSKAAVLHDWLYTCQTRSRREADRIFLEAMQVSGVDGFTRHLFYGVVRLVGWHRWRQIETAKAARKKPALS